MILKINNDYSYLETTDVKTKQFLWDKLRFREKNYFHNSRYKRHLWDGYTDFFNRETGKFLTGLLPEVKAALKVQNVAPEINDLRQKTEFNIDVVDEKFLAGVVLHDYQVDYINQAIKKQRGIIFSPTSSGKTLMMVGILKAIKEGTPTLILQNRKPLAEQNYEELCKWGFKNVGKLWGGTGNQKPNLITVATVQSIHKIAKILPKVKCVIVDEIHDMMSKVPKAVYRRLTGCTTRIALSATPFKFGETDDVQKFYVKGFFGAVLKTKTTESGRLTTKELQDRKILAKSKCIFYPVNEPKLPYDVYIDAVTNGIANNHHFHEMVTRLAKKQKGRTLILVDRIAHGDALFLMIPNSLWVQGKDTSETRQEAVKQLQTSKKDVVILATQQIFNTGINVFVHNLINAASGQAEHQIIQRMGRGLRTTKDKLELNYYDFVFNINDYLLEHSKKRIKILKKEGHEVEIREQLDF